ncbi:hypothetical protein C9374_012819 [Naegleria lovaniensis]|uniref:Uncharacterized protein n=1 Tax=Naegleria lovaniensis TaxID=51637 RepID=A0AA88KHP9_NAELO|nr:uncharacterized protein C9374_012819 [Naegleria lovaniensis]KAG2373087.1 hypothetical protein C9374_012819 [Naegleria lovaniensis]
MPAPVPASPLFPNSELDPKKDQITNTLEKLDSVVVTTLNGYSQTVSGSVNKNSWNYYKISIPSRTAMTLSYTSYDSITVYVKEGSIPSSYDYDYILLSQYSVKTIVSTSLNQTTTYYIGVAGGYSYYTYSSYTLSLTLDQGALANWVIGVIIGSAIFSLCVVFIIILVPILICCGVCAAVTGSNSSSQPKNHNTTVTTYHVKTPILTRVSTPPPPQYHTTTQVVTPPLPPQNDAIYYNANLNNNYYNHTQTSQNLQQQPPYQTTTTTTEHDVIYNPNMPSQAVNYHKI